MSIDDGRNTVPDQVPRLRPVTVSARRSEVIGAHHVGCVRDDLRHPPAISRHRRRAGCPGRRVVSRGLGHQQVVPVDEHHVGIPPTRSAGDRRRASRRSSHGISETTDRSLSIRRPTPRRRHGPGGSRRRVDDGDAVGGRSADQLGDGSTPRAVTDGLPPNAAR